MQKKFMIITVVVVVLVAAGTIVFFLNSQNNTPPVKSVIPTPAPLAPSETLKDYQDPAGFIFSYPDDVQVKSEESTSSAIYSLLTLTSKKTEGKISIEVADTKLRSTDAYLTTNKISSPSATIQPKKLGELDGIEVKQDNTITLIAIDEGILFTILVTPSQETKYWDNVYSTISSSFAFNAPEAPAQESSSTVPDTSGDEIILEEDVVE